MLSQQLTAMIGVFRISKELDLRWSPQDRNAPSLYHWSALMHTMVNVNTEALSGAYVALWDAAGLAFSVDTRRPVHEMIVNVAAKTLGDGSAAANLVEALAQCDALPGTIVANLREDGVRRRSSAILVTACGAHEQNEALLRSF